MDRRRQDRVGTWKTMDRWDDLVRDFERAIDRGELRQAVRLLAEFKLTAPAATAGTGKRGDGMLGRRAKARVAAARTSSRRTAPTTTSVNASGT